MKTLANWRPMMHGQHNDKSKRLFTKYNKFL